MPSYPLHSSDDPRRFAHASADAAAAQPVFADLHLLTIIGQTRSYTQAARRLGISKASVSQRITALERAAGVPLVQRSTRSVALTAAGQQLADEAGPAFARIAQSFSAVKDLASTPRGLVRLTAPVALGRQHVMPALAPFLHRYPDIRIELDLNDRLVNLVQEGFDLAIRHTQAPPDTYVAWPLCETRSLLVASADYLVRRGAPAHPRELAAHDCLVYLRGGSAASNWTLVRTRRRGEPEHCSVPVRGPIQANNSETLRDAALAGLGIALLPDFSATSLGADQPATGRHAGLLPVLADWQPQGFFGGRIYAIRPWAPQVPRAVQVLVEHLRASFRQGFPAAVGMPS
ncbi:LysR family transcriptional regulator [Corticibacter populi]|uniref:LysR family transcriptional regulator n=1 Tax=Corticibacter populi TaxID=1550736 RepID=A0A3M6QZC1_9BURK|nr:LysR family transcriptional regulator [Corticibacter populi]RMX08367.1 LysR family transcriptional regulator [Corticibacter populi]RZS35661.1 LysR family transcriptional regulator [Corticibacter populi]